MKKYLNSDTGSQFVNIRISAHSLRIETDRRSKNYIDRTLKKCQYCILDEVEDEKHFIIECPLYDPIRTELLNNITNQF